jgi:uncharacterized membrane protein
MAIAASFELACIFLADLTTGFGAFLEDRLFGGQVVIGPVPDVVCHPEVLTVPEVVTGIFRSIHVSGLLVD